MDGESSTGPEQSGGEPEGERILPEVTRENLESLRQDIADDERYKKFVNQLEEEQPMISKWLTLFGRDLSTRERETALMSAVVVYHSLRSQVQKSKMKL